MLEITGYLKGNRYDTPTPIRAEDLAKAFRLPDRKQLGVLEMAPNFISTRDGEVRFPPSLSTSPEFTTTTSDGDSFTLRYYKSRSPIPGSPGHFNFAPKNIRISGRTVGFPTEDYEKFVWWALSPHCTTSPAPGRRAMYGLYDPAAAKSAAEKAAYSIQTMMQVLTTAPEDRIVAKSLGMIVKNQSTGVPASAPAAMHRAKLMQLLVVSPSDFVAAWQAEDNTLKGALALCSDRGLVFQSSDAGRPCWRWKHNNQIATFFAPDQDAFRALYDWANQASNSADAMNIVSGLLSLDASEVEVAGAAPVEEREIAAATKDAYLSVVENALENGDIFYSKAAKVVYLELENGEAEDFFKPKTSTWKQELVEYLKSEEGRPSFERLSKSE